MRKIIATLVLTALLLCLAADAFAQSPTPAATPAPGSILQTTGSMGNLNTFTSLANKAGLNDALSRGGPYTVLAPSDDAFRRMPSGALNALSNDTPRLQAVMRNHVVQGRYTANDLLTTKKITTLDNKTLVITPRQGYVKVGRGFITREDTPAGNNSIIQVIDTVMIPS